MGATRLVAFRLARQVASFDMFSRFALLPSTTMGLR